MNREADFTVVIKDMLLLFAVLASVGSFYHAKLVAGIAYLAAAAALHYEAGLRLWLRRHFSSDV